jgi:hypothetical protein
MMAGGVGVTIGKLIPGNAGVAAINFADSIILFIQICCCNSVYF